MTHRTPEEFGTDFDSLFRRSAFRLEQLDRYVAANEAEPFRRFLAGEPQDPSWRGPWKEFVRAALRDGKQMARVHVVREPLSDYLEFELTCSYPANVNAGEDVRVLRRTIWPHLRGLPDHDYWLFDNAVAAVMIYDEDGNFLGADMISDPGIIARYRRARDLAMRHSVRLADYLASLGMKEAV
jgi:hypothetical protein